MLLPWGESFVGRAQVDSLTGEDLCNKHTTSGVVGKFSSKNTEIGAENHQFWRNLGAKLKL